MVVLLEAKDVVLFLPRALSISLSPYTLLPLPLLFALALVLFPLFSSLLLSRRRLPHPPARAECGMFCSSGVGYTLRKQSTLFCNGVVECLGARSFLQSFRAQGCLSLAKCRLQSTDLGATSLVIGEP